MTYMYRLTLRDGRWRWRSYNLDPLIAVLRGGYVFMQNAKDTFYMTLRDRLAAVNPARTMVVRGVTRPGSLVEENELVSADQPVDAFCLRWTGCGWIRGSRCHWCRCSARFGTARMAARAMAGWIAGDCWRRWMRSWLRR